MTTKLAKRNFLKSSNVQRMLAAAGVAAASLAIFVVAYFNPVTAGFFPQCPFRQLTGLNCPGCGLTRGFHALFHGDILSALHFNALLPFYALLLGYLFLSLLLVAARGHGLPLKTLSPAALYGFLALSVIFTVVRNLPFYPFNLLAI